MQKSQDFIKIEKEEEWKKIVWKCIDSGYIIYLVNALDHIEIGYPSENDIMKTIGGGSNVAVKDISNRKISKFINERAKTFIYLGYLTKNL